MSAQRFGFLGCHGGRTNGQATAHGRALGTHRTLSTATETASQGRSEADRTPPNVDRHLVRTQDRHPLGGSSAGDGLWMRHDLLASAARVARSRCLAGHPPRVAQPIARGRQDRLVTSFGRQRFRSGGFWGEKTGPNPTYRRKPGSKHHVITDANGIPLAVTLTGANHHDLTQLLPLINAIPAIAGQVGRPRYRPDCVQGDRAYDSEPHRQAVREVGIYPILAKRRSAHGSGLGIFRWVVERTLSWLHQFRRLRVRYERRDDIHGAFLTIGCILICSNFI